MKKNFCRTSGTSEKQFSELESKNVFGIRLRTLRVERGYTLDEACKKLEGKVKSSILGKCETLCYVADMTKRSGYPHS